MQPRATATVSGRAMEGLRGWEARTPGAPLSGREPRVLVSRGAAGVSCHPRARRNAGSWQMADVSCLRGLAWGPQVTQSGTPGAK